MTRRRGVNLRAMPPRHAYWTILIDDQPTAFRAHDPEELLPTLNRLREKNQSAVMKWFERGKLFDSRDQARDAGLGQGERRWEGPRPERDDDGPRFARDEQRSPGTGRAQRPGPGDANQRVRGENRAPRDKNWRPGGEHRDPRQKYKDAKKAKWNRFKDKIRERHEERGPRNPESFTPPHGDKLPTDRRSEARPSHDRRPQWRDDRGGRGERPPDRRPREPWPPGPAAKPHGDKMGARPPRPEWRREDDRLGGGKSGGDREQRPWSNRPPRRENDRDQRAWSDRPPRREDDRDQRPWSDRPPRPPRREDDRDQRSWKERPPRRDNDRGSQPWSDRPPRRDDARGGGGSSRSREDSGGWRPKGPGAGRKPLGGSDSNPWSGKPAGGGGRKPWTSKPGGAKTSWGSKSPGRPAAGGRPPKRRRDDE